MQFSTKVYDTLKWFVQILMPAFITFYATLSDLWDFPNVVQVIGTLAAVTTFFGILLGLSSASYKATNAPNAGTVQQLGADPDTGMPHMAVTFNGDPSELAASNRTLTFKVAPPPPPPAQN